MADTDDPNSRKASEGGGALGFLRRFAGAVLNMQAQEPEPDGAAGDLLTQARRFQNLKVGDVMKPRSDIVALECQSTFEDVVRRFADSEHSRMPVYRDTLDAPVGVVHIKDVFKLQAATPSRRPKPGDHVLTRRKSLVREPLYVPASMSTVDLLAQMRKQHIHMALVIDEFGGTDGLVTLEDLLERLVGDIADEHDEDAPPIVEDERGWVVDGRLLLPELEAAMGGEDLAPPDLDEEIDTVAGLVTALAGRVPRARERVPHPGGFEFEVVAADPRRVKRVRVHRAPAAEEPNPA